MIAGALSTGRHIKQQTATRLALALSCSNWCDIRSSPKAAKSLMLYGHRRRRTALTVYSAPTALIFSRLFVLGAVASPVWRPKPAWHAGAHMHPLKSLCNTGLAYDTTCLYWDSRYWGIPEFRVIYRLLRGHGGLSSLSQIARCTLACLRDSWPLCIVCLCNWPTSYLVCSRLNIEVIICHRQA